MKIGDEVVDELTGKIVKIIGFKEHDELMVNKQEVTQLGFIVKVDSPYLNGERFNWEISYLKENREEHCND